MQELRTASTCRVRYALLTHPTHYIGSNCVSPVIVAPEGKLRRRSRRRHRTHLFTQPISPLLPNFYFLIISREAFVEELRLPYPVKPASMFVPSTVTLPDTFACLEEPTDL